MTGALRFIGIFNAAFWLGASLYFSFVAGPAFFSEEMKRLIPPPYNGAAAELLIQRYFIFQHVCAGVALLHCLLERLIAGRGYGRATVVILVFIFSLGLIGGFGLQPKLRALHWQKYRGATVELREEAAADFKKWHAVSRVADIVMLPCLLFYFWRLSNSNGNSRTIVSRRNWAGLS